MYNVNAGMRAFSILYIAKERPDPETEAHYLIALGSVGTGVG